MVFKLMKFQDGIDEPPYDYYFLLNLDEKEYPKYLAKVFYLNTGEKLPLSNGVIDKKRCKTFNQKMQWLKLYGVTDFMRYCTDKVKVIDYVKEKIGEEYLKPVLQIIPEKTMGITNKRGVALNSFQGSDLNDNHKMLKHACINDKTGNENINHTAVQHDSQLGALKPKIAGACHSENLENQNNNSVDFQVVQNLKKESKDEKTLKRVQCDTTLDALQPDFINKNDVSGYFDRIDFDKLPNNFVIKCNHGSKWQFIIKDKEEFLQNKHLFNLIKRKITGWLEQDYAFWCGFELNYRNIKPKILIEPLMRDEINTPCEEIQIYCFNGEPLLIFKLFQCNKQTAYNNKFEIADDLFESAEETILLPADDNIKQAFNLSKKLGSNFNFVRVDWMIHQNKLYFEELTFTPYSGFFKFGNRKNNIKLGQYLNI